MNNQRLFVSFFPVQFSRCIVKVLSILQNDTEIIISYPVKSRRQLRWLTIVSGVSAVLPVFPAPASSFENVDLGYDPLSQIISP